jgi:glycosyltransferase involved in cell wall biosynthesis
MRVLWYSPSPFFGSGYGVATAAIVPRLQAAGHEVLIFSPTHHGRAPVQYKGMTIVGITGQPYGTDMVGHYVAEFLPDVVITMYDEWVLGSFQDILGNLYLPWVVNHYEPMEPILRETVKKTWRQLAFSPWSAQVMKEAGLDARVVPLGVDTKQFCPLIGSLDDTGRIIEKKELKKQFGAYEDEFLIGMVAANIDFRKNLEGQFRVFADFWKTHKDSRLFIKTNPEAPGGGWKIPDMIQAMFGLTTDNPRAPVSYTKDGNTDLSGATMALWYNAFDVYLGCSYSESVGLPLVEANACGVPAIYTDFSGMPYYAYGWPVKGTMELNILYSFGCRPDEQSMWNALDAAYKQRGTPEAQVTSALARAHSLQFDWDVTVKTLLRELEDWVLDKPL